jgi:hypothetical protein
MNLGKLRLILLIMTSRYRKESIILKVLSKTTIDVGVNI